MSKLSRNIIFNLVGQALTVGLGFFATRDIFRQLGDDALGLLFFAITTNAVLATVIDFGVSATVVREVARHLDTDRAYLVRLMRTCTTFYWCVYALLAVIFWLSAPWLVSRWITLKTLDAVVAVRVLRLLALGLLLMLPRSLYSNVLRGVERMEFNNLIDTGAIALQQAGIILIVVHGLGLVRIADCYLACYLLSVLAYIVVATMFLPGRAFLPGFSRDVVQKNASFTSHVGAYTILSAIHMEFDKIVMSKLLPIGLLGFYGVAQSTVIRVTRVTAAVTSAALPAFSALFQARDRTALMREYRRLQDLVCYGLVPVFGAVIFAARPLFTYLLDAHTAQILLLPTSLLCLGWFMNTTLNIPAILAVAVARPDIGARQNFYALFVVLPVTVGLIWKWQLVGAGLSFVFYELYSYSYGARRIASECLAMAPRNWYLHVLKILALASITYGAAWSILMLAGLNSIALLAVAYILASAVYLYAAYLAVGQELREGFIGLRGRVAGGVLRYITPS
jgi:O-antigen/teichoic acid export membrane protein